MPATATQDERIRVDYLRFDLLLVAIPIALFSGLLSAALLPISQAAGLVIGAATAAVLVAYSMYELVRLDSPNTERSDEFGEIPQTG